MYPTSMLSMDLKKEPRGKMVLLYRLSTKRFWWLATGSRNALQALGTGPSGDACQKMFAKKNPSMPIFTHCITPPPKSLVRDKKKKVHRRRRRRRPPRLY